VTTTCDSTTMELLRRVVGMRLEKVAARRYPGYLAYGEVVATFTDGLSIRIDLTDEIVAPKFEVCVARARPVEPPSELTEWDRIELGDFVVASVFVLRREEWIERSSKTTHQPVGQHGVEQRFGAIDDENEERQVVIVDSGFCFLSTQGAELSLDADTFPLVLQLRYEVTPSPLPESKRIAVNEHRTPQ
jgi:hypothetical protein